MAKSSGSPPRTQDSDEGKVDNVGFARQRGRVSVVANHGMNVFRMAMTDISEERGGSVSTDRQSESTRQEHARMGANLIQKLHRGDFDGPPTSVDEVAKELPMGWFALELFDIGEYPATGGASGLFLDVKGSTKRKGAPLIVWPAGGGEDEVAESEDNGAGGIPDNQLWRFEPSSGNLFSRIGYGDPKHGGDLVMDVAGGDDEPGGKLITWPQVADAPNQHFAVAAAEFAEPWMPVLPSMSAPEPNVPDLEITTGRRVTPLGDPDMPPEIAALLAGTMLPPSLAARNGRASGRASGRRTSGIQQAFRGYEVLNGHGGGLLVTLCLPLCEHQGKPLAVGVLQGVAAVVSRRASNTIARRTSAGSVNAGGQVVTLGGGKAKLGPSNGGGCITKWRVIPAGSEGVVVSGQANQPPLPPGFERPMRRGS